jgi:hypothetical protein
MTGCSDEQERLDRLIVGLRPRIEESQRSGGSCAGYLDQCLILELLNLTLRDLEIRKAELKCAVTKRRAEALVSGWYLRASAAPQAPDSVASWAGFRLRARSGRTIVSAKT